MEWGGGKRHKDSRSIGRNIATALGEFNSMGDNGEDVEKHK